MATVGAPPVSGPGQFSQRTDQAPGQPVRVPTGLPYGKAKQLEQAQQAVPLPASPGGTPPPSLGAGPAPTGPSPIPQRQQPLGAPLPPNSLELLSHPTQRPNEPVTAPSSIRGQKVIPQSTVIAALEDLMARADSVPENVMNLYQQLRMEASRSPSF